MPGSPYTGPPGQAFRVAMRRQVSKPDISHRGRKNFRKMRKLSVNRNRKHRTSNVECDHPLLRSGSIRCSAFDVRCSASSRFRVPMRSRSLELRAAPEPQGRASRRRGMRAVRNNPERSVGNRGAQRTDAPYLCRFKGARRVSTSGSLSRLLKVGAPSNFAHLLPPGRLGTLAGRNTPVSVWPGITAGQKGRWSAAFIRLQRARVEAPTTF
jgi:hypothetical protein